MNYQVAYKLDINSVELIKELFGCAWWTKDRNSESIERMLRGSVCVGVREPEGKLVGFARAITDGVFKAIIVDVIVAVDHRRQGICRLLIDALLEHRALSAVRDFELYCQPDLVELYRKWGFQESPNGVTFMRASRVG
jgi:ribosomal protein S18 acetylase RimI-like enzyme